jgi:hypothetical protein
MDTIDAVLGGLRAGLLQPVGPRHFGLFNPPALAAAIAATSR